MFVFSINKALGEIQIIVVNLGSIVFVVCVGSEITVENSKKSITVRKHESFCFLFRFLHSPKLEF